ncbi:hypothetical protein, partial [Brucella abortus]|uniref:hypothetical protein n=1 Tax=Brucella abortus TaxID=235 RepID=UPI003F5B14C3
YAHDTAKTRCGEFLLRLIDESKLHRLFGRKTVRWTVLSSASTLTKKAVARFNISRSCRKISFSRRRRFTA